MGTRIRGKLKGGRPSSPPLPAPSSLLAHEVRNYICALKGDAMLLRQYALGPEQQAIAARIERVVEKLERFTFSAPPESGAKAAAMGARLRVPVYPVEVALACAATHFPGRPEGFRWDAPAGLPPVLGDPCRLEQAFLNLFLNAFEAGAGCLQISFRARYGVLQVTIEDDGRGCEETELERLLQLSAPRRGGDGRERGLGLFIVQSILAEHRCHVKAHTKNVPGGSSHGLIFTLAFPHMHALAWQGPAPVPRSAAVTAAVSARGSRMT